MISKSGATAELVELIPVLRQFQSPLIGIVGNLSCPLVEKVDIVLDARVAREADPLNLAPTCSTTVALGVGDALAVALMRVVDSVTLTSHATIHRDNSAETCCSGVRCYACGEGGCLGGTATTRCAQS